MSTARRLTTKRMINDARHYKKTKNCIKSKSNSHTFNRNLHKMLLIASQLMLLNSIFAFISDNRKEISSAEGECMMKTKLSPTSMIEIESTIKNYKGISEFTLQGRRPLWR